jgi:DNA repair ATPase RecN
MNPVRMESQIVRDSLLHLAGELDLSLGGPSIAVNDEASRRRSLYFVHSHNDHQKFLSTFDDANVLDCYRRAESIVPQQALALENSPLATGMAGKIAQRIATARPNASDSDFIRFAFVTILSVEPTAAEQTTMSELLNRMTELARAKRRPTPEVLARTNLVLTLLNHNDFITIR